MVAETVASELNVGGFGKKSGNMGAKDGLSREEEGAAAKNHKENDSKGPKFFFADVAGFFGGVGATRNVVLNVGGGDLFGLFGGGGYESGVDGDEFAVGKSVLGG